MVVKEYLRRPMRVEAVWHSTNGNSTESLIQWVRGFAEPGSFVVKTEKGQKVLLVLVTDHFEKCGRGDYLMRDEHCQFVVVPRDEFERDYEEVK